VSTGSTVSYFKRCPETKACGHTHTANRLLYVYQHVTSGVQRRAPRRDCSGECLEASTGERHCSRPGRRPPVRPSVATTQRPHQSCCACVCCSSRQHSELHVAFSSHRLVTALSPRASSCSVDKLSTTTSTCTTNNFS